VCDVSGVAGCVGLSPPAPCGGPYLPSQVCSALLVAVVCLRVYHHHIDTSDRSAMVRQTDRQTATLHQHDGSGGHADRGHDDGDDDDGVRCSAACLRLSEWCLLVCLQVGYTLDLLYIKFTCWLMMPPVSQSLPCPPPVRSPPQSPPPQQTQPPPGPPSQAPETRGLNIKLKSNLNFNSPSAFALSGIPGLGGWV
jgi:hypothetical protein